MVSLTLGAVMASHQNALSFLLIAAVALLCVLPQVDRPQTPFDESDSPTVQATPVTFSLSFVRPVARPIVLPKSSDGKRDEIFSLVETASPVMPRHFGPLRDLLCTLLI
jgi:hypothetical protein